MFPEDDRVVALFAEARRRFGEDILRDPRRSVPMLADQAPELRGVIKATAGALGIGAPERLRAAPDQASEFHRLANEIAGRDGVAYNDAMAGIRIAARIGGGPPPPGAGPVPRPPDERSWIGGSAVPGVGAQHGMPGPAPVGPPPGYGTPGYGAPPPSPGTAQDFMKGRWGIAALVGLGALVVIGLSLNSGQDPQAPQAPQAPPRQAPQAPPSGAPAGRPQQPPAGQPPQSAGLPVVVPPGGGQRPPGIPLRDAQQAFVIEFGVSSNNQLFRVIVGVSRQGWDAGFVAVASQGASEPESLSQPGPFQLTRQNNNAIRVLQPAWQRDGLNIGGMCVAFVQPGAADVQLRGSNVCVLAGNCEQMIGCGVVQ